MTKFEELEQSTILLEMNAGLLTIDNLFETIPFKLRKDPQMKAIQDLADKGDQNAKEEIEEGMKEFRIKAEAELEDNDMVFKLNCRSFAAIAQIQRTYFEKLVDAGFNEEQALQLTLKQNLEKYFN